MAKDIFSFRNKTDRRWFTETVKRIVLWDIAIFFFLFITSNIFTIFITNKILNDNLDSRIINKIETLDDLFEISGDSVKFIGYSELKEPSFTHVSANSFFMQAYNTKGILIFRSNNLSNFSPIPFSISGSKLGIIFFNSTIKDRELRTAISPIINKGGKTMAYLQLSAFKSENDSIMKEIVFFNLFNLPIIFFMIVIASFFLAKKSFVPLNNIISTAENISANNLNTRIEYKADPDDELGRLRDTLNNLFTRLEVQVNQISQFTDNASHQLMTPLTAIKTELEYILKRDRTPNEYRETLAVLNFQTDKMISIIKSLLIIAKFSGKPELYKNVFNVTQTIEEGIKPIFANYNIIYDINNNLYLRGSSEGFQIILENLIENAIKFSPENSNVSVKVFKSNNHLEIIVEDFGIGVKDEENEKIFERFYRSSNVKENVNGYGLGLCLVKTIVLAMNGNIKVEKNVPNGTRFIIKFQTINIE